MSYKTDKKVCSKKVGHTRSEKVVVHVPFSTEAWLAIKDTAASKGMAAATFVRMASLAACEK